MRQFPFACLSVSLSVSRITQKAADRSGPDLCMGSIDFSLFEKRNNFCTPKYGDLDGQNLARC